MQISLIQDFKVQHNSRIYSHSRGNQNAKSWLGERRSWGWRRVISSWETRYLW